MSLSNVSLVWMGQTLNIHLLVKNAVVSPKNKMKKLQNSFFSPPTMYFLPFFLRMSPQKVCRNCLSTKSTFKAAQKLTPS